MLCIPSTYTIFIANSIAFLHLEESWDIDETYSKDVKQAYRTQSETSDDGSNNIPPAKASRTDEPQSDKEESEKTASLQSDSNTGTKKNLVGTTIEQSNEKKDEQDTAIKVLKTEDELSSDTKAEGTGMVVNSESIAVTSVFNLSPLKVICRISQNLSTKT